MAKGRVLVINHTASYPVVDALEQEIENKGTWKVTGIDSNRVSTTEGDFLKVLILGLSPRLEIGYGLVAQAKQRWPNAHLYVVSHHAGQAVKDRCKELGAYKFIHPILDRPKDIVAEIEKPPES